MIAIPVPAVMSRLFQQMDVPRDVNDPSDHITMFYLGDNVSIDRLVQIIPILYKACSKISPMKVSCKRITSFPKGEGGYPVIGEIQSKELVSLRDKIRGFLEQNNIKFDKKHNEYRPHVTLGYSKKKPKNVSFPKVEWTIGEIALYGGDDGDQRLFVNFPLSLGDKKAMDELEILVQGYDAAVKSLTRRG